MTSKRPGSNVVPRYRIPAAVFLGEGLFVGAPPAGPPFVYEGGVVRVRAQDLPPPADECDRRAWEAGMELVLRQVDALHLRSDCTPVEGAPLELSGCVDAEGDWLVMWRIACVGVVRH